MQLLVRFPPLCSIASHTDIAGDPVARITNRRGIDLDPNPAAVFAKHLHFKNLDPGLRTLGLPLRHLLQRPPTARRQLFVQGATDHLFTTEAAHSFVSAIHKSKTQIPIQLPNHIMGILGHETQPLFAFTQLGFNLFLPVDISNHANHPQIAPVAILHNRGGNQSPEHAPVLADKTMLLTTRFDLAGQHGLKMTTYRRRLIRMCDIAGHQLAARFPAQIAKHPAPATIDIDKTPLPIGQ